VRLAAAIGLGLVLVPVWGAAGAALGFLVSEALLLVLAARATDRAGFAVPVSRPLALGCAATVPMAVVVALWKGGTLASVAVGVVTYAATLAAAWWLARRTGFSRLASPGRAGLVPPGRGDAGLVPPGRGDAGIRHA
jgi:hypothetical protein